ncbi:MAG TPA: DUF4389 domain-containing protein [Candidatus Pacearchaeota archaeon]|nr:DUF4389 domain-containing protein [Candidatus Pacearchaeota archaeon]HOR52457.1 DUF4389 domain-containing protein [Candidatus Pacearchaeota archaeon]HOU79237.1 DUF4389 domain-containing protein [Candidatus Pacearchaeota archaeon]HQF82568.1 DUF4389 domain-containing protein [Candidatus Pacearchaeota archaeon]HQI57792.1 DUF4389 domain-containing protein [Candidatus Pacearchaeota archaeon]
MTRKNKGEVWMRIPVFIISGIILYVWGFFIFCFAIAQFVLILFKGKREKELLKMSNIYLVQLHIFIRYVTFLSDKRPFPFGELEKEIKKEK